jgi:hypothetical protein
VQGEFERLARRKQKKNPRFAFLFGGDGADYYQYKLMQK